MDVRQNNNAPVNGMPHRGKYGDNVGDMQNQASPRGGALSRPKIKC